MNPLLMIPSPREIPEFEEATSKLKIDKLWLKFYPQVEAYERGRQFFLQHNEYTHLIILPDDLIVTQETLDQLLKDLEQEPEKVISGYCNVTAGSTDWEDANISYSLPPVPPITGTYEGYHWMKLADLKDKQEIIEVKHAGFGLTAIPKKIVEQIPFRGDSGCCMDSCFSLDLDKQGIKLYVDTRVASRHMRTDPSIIQTGKREPEMKFSSLF